MSSKTLLVLPVLEPPLLPIPTLKFDYFRSSDLHIFMLQQSTSQPWAIAPWKGSDAIVLQCSTVLGSDRLMLWASKLLACYLILRRSLVLFGTATAILLAILLIGAPFG